MDLSRDYEDLFKILNKHKVRYLLVGAYAVVYYTEPRFTKDIDVWVGAGLDNARSLFAALKEFGAPLKNITLEDLANERNIYQIGVAPVRVDILMGLPGMKFDAAWKNRKTSRYGKTPIHIIGIEELVRMKKKAGRLQDRLDLEKLRVYKKYSAR